MCVWRCFAEVDCCVPCMCPLPVEARRRCQIIWTGAVCGSRQQNMVPCGMGLTLTSQLGSFTVWYFWITILSTVMVIKGDKSKTSLFFSTASVSQDLITSIFPILLNIVSQVVFFSVFFNSTKMVSTVKWSSGHWESSLDTALLGSTTLPPTS